MPLRNTDVVRRTNTTLDVLLGRREDDCWNVDGDWNQSEPWTSFMQLTILNEKPPDGYMWSGERLTTIRATSRPDHLWPPILSGMLKKQCNEEKGSNGPSRNRSSAMRESCEAPISSIRKIFEVTETMKNALRGESCAKNPKLKVCCMHRYSS